METNDTLQVDVDKVLADKNPGLARLLPRFVKAYLKKIVHQDEVNYVLRSFSHQPPVGFVRSTLDYMEITHRAVGLERLSLDGRYLFRLEPSLRRHGRHDALRRTGQLFRFEPHHRATTS